MRQLELKTLGAVYIYIYISRLLEKENKETNRIKIDNIR